MGRPNDELILYIDIETSGLDPERHQIIEIAAKIDDLSTPVAELPSFHCYVPHDEIVGQPYALWLNRVALQRIADREDGYNYYQPDEIVYPYLWDFVYRNGFTEHDRITLGGKNVGAFDVQHLKRLPDWDSFVRHRHRYVDPGTLWWRPEHDGTEIPCLAVCKERAGVEGEVEHTAMPDVDDTIRCVRGALEQQRKWQHAVCRLEGLEK